MLILSDVSDNVSQSTTNFTVDLTSIVLAAVSAVICFAALIVSIVIARRDARYRFEAVVEECLMPIAIFIQDIFVIRSDKNYIEIAYVKEGDNKLVEGLHRLRVFAITNGYKFLEEATKIHSSNKNKSDGSNNEDSNDMIFSYCLLKLEYRYMEFRKKHETGTPSKSEVAIMKVYSALFQRYLKLISKYMFAFMSKKNFKNSEDYYKELKEIHTEAQELWLKEKSLQKTNKKRQARQKEANQ